MDEQRLDDQIEPIYNSSVPIQDVAWKTCRERWMKETSGEKGSGKSVLTARHDYDYDIYIYIYKAGGHLLNITQSDGAVEYTNLITAEG